MKKSILIVSILLFTLSTGCKKNDDNGPTGPLLQNEPPLAFNLIDIANETTGVELRPTLSWESAKNPKGREVTYDLYLDQSLNPTTVVENNIGDTSLEITARLEFLTDYYWKIVATDSDGMTAQSSINKFTTRNLRIPEAPVTEDAGFASRIRHTTTVFDNKLWVIGGTSQGVNTRNDVWYSSDGVEWKEATSEAAFPKKNLHTTVVFDNKLWVIGGYDGDFSNDVWYSSNGITWEEATSNAQFSPRYSHTATVFNNKIWVIGGNSEEGLTNEVWYSEDGANWIEATDGVPFSSRSGHATVVFDNKLWLVGGALDGFFNISNGVWYSSDGMNWTEVIVSKPLPNKSGHNLASFDDKIWVIGGGSLTNKGDAWYSRDGIDWVQVYENVPLLDRNSASLTVFKDRLWMVAGQENATLKNDVWTLD